jgi:predicted enzyme related to lactoylglutathione lyase
MLNLNSIMIGTTRAKELVAFYAQVLGKPADMASEEHGFYGWQAGSTYFSVLAHSEMEGNAKEPGRILLNFETPHVQDEFDRIKALGGTVISAPHAMGDGWLATLADPDGNYFQLVTPMS